jgi:isochorismate hydrolase
MKLKVVELFEDIGSWDEHPITKIFDLYSYFINSSDTNMKLEIADEILEDIDGVMNEFRTNDYKMIYLQKVKENVNEFRNKNG